MNEVINARCKITTNFQYFQIIPLGFLTLGFLGPHYSKMGPKWLCSKQFRQTALTVADDSERGCFVGMSDRIAPVFYGLLEDANEFALVVSESRFEFGVHTIVGIGAAVVEIPDEIAVIETACAIETGHNRRHF